MADDDSNAHDLLPLEKAKDDTDCPFPDYGKDLEPLPFRPVDDSSALTDESSFNSEIMSTLNAVSDRPCDDDLESILLQLPILPPPFPATKDNEDSITTSPTDDDDDDDTSMMLCNVFDINSCTEVNGVSTEDHHRASASVVSAENDPPCQDSQDAPRFPVNKSSLLLELPDENKKYVLETKTNAERWERKFNELKVSTTKTTSFLSFILSFFL